MGFYLKFFFGKHQQTSAFLCETSKHRDFISRFFWNTWPNIAVFRVRNTRFHFLNIMLFKLWNLQTLVFYLKILPENIHKHQCFCVKPPNIVIIFPDFPGIHNHTSSMWETIHSMFLFIIAENMEASLVYAMTSQETSWNGDLSGI